MRTDPTYWVMGCAGCLSDWMVTRAWPRIILSSLPLFAAVGVGLLVLFGSRLSRDRLAEHYLELANAEVESWEDQWAPKGTDAKAASDKPNDQSSGTDNASSSSGSPQDPSSTASGGNTNAEATKAGNNASDSADAKPKSISPYAELLFRRVQQLQQNDSRSMFFVAMGYLQRGATQQAYEMLMRLAPADRIGYLPAHAFLAEFYLTRPVPANQVPTVVHHADATMRWDRAPAKLLAMISQLYKAVKNRDRAVAALQLAADRDPQFLLELARLAGEEVRFKAYAEQALTKALTVYANRLNENPRSVTSRLMYADALASSNQMGQAESLLLEGLQLEDSQELKRALSEIYCAQFVQSSRFMENAWSGNIDLLDRAFRLDPNNGRVFDEVAKLARFTGEAPNEELMAQLRQNLAEGRATSITHMWIAERYLVLEQYQQAIPHLEQAVARDPKAARCWNNLAFCLNAVAPERRQEALECSNKAIQLSPTEHDYYDTRGTILMTLEKPREAIASFEQAIELIAARSGQLPPQVGYHERLAEAYQSIGNDSMAKTHTQLAVQIRKRYDAWLEEQTQAKQTNENKQPADGAAAVSSVDPKVDPQVEPKVDTKVDSEVDSSASPKAESPSPTEPTVTSPQP